MFCTGSLLAFVGHRLLVARSPNPFGPTHRAAVGFGFLYWAGVQYMVVVAPDWMLNYFVPVQDISLAAVDAVFLLACLLAAWAGHVLTAVHLQRGHPGAAFGVLLAGAGVLFGLWGLTLDSYVHVGTRAEYLAGVAPLLPASAIGTGMNVFGGALALAWAVLAAGLYRASRHLRAT